MLSDVVCLPKNQNVKSKEIEEMVLNIMKIYMAIGETMPSKLPGLDGLLGGIDLAVNAMDDTVISDKIKITLQKCKSIQEHETIKKTLGPRVISWY